MNVLAEVALLLAGGFLAVQAVTAAVNAATFPRLRVPGAEAADEVGLGGVSLLVPVRNEAETLPETLPRLLAQGAGEVVILDDRSEDASAEIVRRFEPGHAELRVIEGEPLPDGWSGKNWACHQLSEAATGDLWVFTDADVAWGDGALPALVAQWQPRQHGFASVWPRQRVVGWIERITVPQVDLVLLGGLPWPLVRRLPFPSLTAGNGQVMGWTREAYRAAGGHAAVRDVVLEDVRMAQRAKAAGVSAFLALGGRPLSTRMYRHASEVIDGFAKNVLPAAGSWPMLGLLWALNVLAYTAAWPLAFLDARWWFVVAGGLLLRGFVARIVGRSVWEALLQPLAPLVLSVIVAQVVRRGGGYVWRGRRYARSRS